MAFQTVLDSDSYPGVPRAAHYQEANEALLESIEGDPDFAEVMDYAGVIPMQNSEAMATAYFREPFQMFWREPMATCQ